MNITNASFIYYRKPKESKNIHQAKISTLLGLSAWSLNSIINGIEFEKYFKVEQANKFLRLKTVYPGLIIGSGYNHPTTEKVDKHQATEKGDFELGFYFDHTTGMPVIPGSTVKGVLKSVFPKENEKNEENEEIIKEIKAEKLKYLNSILKKIIKKDILLNETNWQTIFDSDDVFFDAYISDIPKNSGGKIFAEDYITPHTKGQFKNPTPIRFLKIAPGVTFTFQFKLVESKIDNVTITPDDKLKLFEKILLDFGIGAKRNVGYGNLIKG